MSPCLIELIFVAEEEQDILRLIKWELEVDEMVRELAQTIEDNILSKGFRYS